MRPNPPKNSEGVIRKTTKPAKCSARPPSASDRGYSALHRALQRLVQRGLGFLVFLLRDSALLVFDFELEDLFFQSSKQ
jgi:hypothetical protein